jgi:hypothetical protein
MVQDYLWKEEEGGSTVLKDEGTTVLYSHGKSIGLYVFLIQSKIVNVFLIRATLYLLNVTDWLWSLFFVIAHKVE